MPLPRVRKPTVAAGSKLPKLTTSKSQKQEEGSQVKRSSSPPHGAPKKRTAFIDITNAHRVQISLPGRKKGAAAKKQVKKTSAPSVSTKNEANLTKSSSVSSEGTAADGENTSVKEEELQVKKEEEEVAVSADELNAAALTLADQKVPAHLLKQQIPAEFDIDSESTEDCYMCPEYAKDIFDYLKQREEKFVLVNYMPTQPSLNPEMRAILIDWLVEVQENFELYHETLYLAVSLVDHYLAVTPVHRELLQLVGSTAMLIASKFELAKHREMLQLVGSTAMLIASNFEERSPPCVDDFLYICDDAYKREELIDTEATILQTLRFDINIPIPYRFLRRYAKCVSAGMDTLTLARFYCELSLMDMALVCERGSLLASACLLLALVTKHLGGWSPILQFHSGYHTSHLAPVARKLHAMLLAPADDKLRSIRCKYAHKVFFEVASLPVVDSDILEKALCLKEEEDAGPEVKTEMKTEVKTEPIKVEIKSESVKME